MEYKTSPMKAIREKCLDCCCGSSLEVKNCTCTNCHLHPYRFGKNPFRQKREMTEEEKDALRERMKEARKNLAKNTNDEDCDD